MIKRNARLIVVICIVIYVLAQIVMPRIGLSLIPNFDASCYSGSFKYFEKVSDDSSCGAGPDDNLIGFPLVANFSYNTAVQNLTVLAIIMSPVLAGSVFLLHTKRR